MIRYQITFSFLLMTYSLLKAQPIGNEGIYLHIYDVINKDTLEVAPTWTGHRSHLINWKNYSLQVETKNSIGFERRDKKDRLRYCFVSGRNTIRIIRNTTDTMKIEFVGFEYPHYLLEVPFQKGHFIFYRPESKQNRLEYQYFPNANINGVYYGHTITPPKWDMFKVKSKNNLNLNDFSFYNMFNRLIPYEALYTGAEVTRHYQESGFVVTDSAKAMLFINQHTAELRIIGNEGKNVKAFYGDLLLDTTTKQLLLKPKYGYAIQAHGEMQETVKNEFRLYFMNEETKKIVDQISINYPEIYQSLTAPLSDTFIFNTTLNGIRIVQLKKDTPKAQLTFEGHLDDKTFIRSFPAEIDSSYTYNVMFFDHTEINQQLIPTFYFSIDKNNLSEVSRGHWGSIITTMELTLNQ
jgi:hypothetical protein